MMRVEQTDLAGVILLEPKRFGDTRGFFAETYNFRAYRDLGIECEFVQDNHSLSDKVGTVRGLHFQKPPAAQAKLVRCGRGSIFDVAVDIRVGSPTYGKWVGFELSADNGLQLFIPAGFAHGFMTLRPGSEIVYKCSDYYAPETEGSVRWNDPDLSIEWPKAEEPVLSEKDAVALPLSKLQSPFHWKDSQ
ncbi:dTDP-4-dehydrorhamnose 3,5-epimerase [Sphingomicrobium astaxanthinifaciens]|uniref:dTDP-4-dehydrorhamnose 3,5-epimerase n=1 Tax=Sphingomicrobium astaxanthinifaciens TaxID=1227949 RepID=UPI001FCA5DA3|nr:dTDP-4-dehydrorhamnose 3,5-epimerase [Sphingomicrobium astaxanthinifaciens]MCJ7420406.1 dTDP-4-dehydrorhamnose 3,5-epimerase [Sphingomicrobium astaxanthinifaciens]